LYDQADYHMELVPFSTFVIDQGFNHDSDLQNMINNGFKFVVTRKKEKIGSFLLNRVIAGAAYCWNKIKLTADSAASFGYSVVKFACHLPGN
jgi:hypothetical protein